MKVLWDQWISIIFFYLCIQNVITIRDYIKGTTKKPPVIYGEPTNYGEAAYFVSIKEKLLLPDEDREYDNYCSGSIIRPDIVVSAAHCFVDRYTEIDWNIQTFHNRIKDRAVVKYSYVVAGQIRSSSERMEDDRPFVPQWRAIKNVIVPSRYHYPANDLALLKLKKEFNYNSNIQPILYAQQLKDYKGLKCLTVGFGKISDLYKNFEPILIKSYVEVLNNTECKKLVPYLEEYSMLCSTTKNTVSLEGDSGGPLVCKHTKDPVERSRGVLVGVLSSYTSTNATIYTRVSAFYKYIDKNGKDEACKHKQSLTNPLMTLLLIFFVKLRITVLVFF